METIFKRRSIRKFKNMSIAKEDIEGILRAAMAAPSAGNEQPWEFIVIDDKNIFEEIMKVHPYSSMLKEAACAIVVCGNEERQKFDGYWVQDCSAATQNALLEATERGLGSVWLGVYPDDRRVNDFKSLFKTPQNIIPFALIALGYPAEEKAPADRYDKSRVHKNGWN